LFRATRGALDAEEPNAAALNKNFNHHG
jgi:hypothetical protein